jgi:methyltransferase (TIGR00027 family)
MTTEAKYLAAQGVAIRRAVHQLMDQPRVFEDPIAIAIIGDEAAKLKERPDKFDHPSSRHVRALMAARSRFAEDEMMSAIASGASQYVIVGAGLDTYAYRTQSSRLRVFEVDHPDTQAWKRTRLQAAGIVTPGSLTFVPMDFGEETLSSALQRSGFEAGQVTFFSWLGVSPYPTADAAMATLAFIGSMPTGSGVVFDYAVSRSSLDPIEQMAMDSLASRVSEAGEPVRLFLDPRALERMLRSAGFRGIEDLGPAEIDGRYFAGRTDGLGIAPGLPHLVSARV